MWHIKNKITKRSIKNETTSKNKLFTNCITPNAPKHDWLHAGDKNWQSKTKLSWTGTQTHGTFPPLRVWMWYPCTVQECSWEGCLKPQKLLPQSLHSSRTITMDRQRPHKFTWRPSRNAELIRQKSAFVTFLSQLLFAKG